ncbi:MAG: hypothetical protein ACRDWE_00240 [Acidimicrobiales bacterium]
MTSLLTRLRATDGRRPQVDPGLAGGLRAWLEDAVADSAQGSRRAGPPLVVGIGDADADGRSDAAGEIARALFLLVVSGVTVRHPLEDAISALSAGVRGAAAAERLRRGARAQRSSARREAARVAETIAAQWRPPPASWLPRLGERLRVPLGGGRVLLAATTDLALGAPDGRTASVSMVQLRPRPPSEGDRSRRRLLALAETLRSGAPPFRVATYHPASGELVCDDVCDTMLALAVEDVGQAL